MSEGPNVGDILIGIFVILFGLCITLVGGGCTAMILASFSGSGGYSDTGFFLLVSLAVLALGLFLIWVGFKLMTGRYRK